MKLKYIIVDDEPLAQRVIEKFAGNIPTLELIGKCKSAFEAMDLLFNQQPDLMFLDINMPNMSDMDFLKTLKNPPIVIITTAYREYALESYDFDVIDYLKKPFSFERFYKSIQKAQEKYKAGKDVSVPSKENIEQTKEYLFVKSDKKIIKIDFSNILFAEAYGDYIKIHTSKEVVLVLMPLKKILEQLPANQFVRVHKSYVIAIDKIDQIEGNTIKIGENEIPVGKNFRQDFINLVKPD